MREKATTLICLFVLFAGFSSRSVAERFRYGGEFSLWVEEQDNVVTVHWLTAEKDSGLLVVSQEGAQFGRFETPRAHQHQVRFRIQNRQPVTLNFGSRTKSYDRHDTLIDFEPIRPQAKLKNVDSLFVIGDIHGEFNHVIALLKSSNVIDAKLRWCGGRRHLVALGDIFDRGHDVIRTLWFLYRLEREAAKSGGAVHVVLGNHEIMAMGYDVRYLSGKERAVADLYGVDYSEMFHPKKSILGRWLASKLAVMKIGNILLAHGGLPPGMANSGIEALNDSLHAFINEPVFLHLLNDSLALSMTDTLSYYRRLQFFHGAHSTFWYRGYVASDTLEKELGVVLKSTRASLHIIAHTPFKTITELYDGQIIDVDLIRPASEMLLLVRKKRNKYLAQKVDMAGHLSPVLPRTGSDPRSFDEDKD